MRRVLQACGVAVVIASLMSIRVPVTGAEVIVSGVTVPPISVVTPSLPMGGTIAVTGIVTTPGMSGISVGMAGTGSGSEREVTYKESTTSEPATIVLGE